MGVNQPRVYKQRPVPEVPPQTTTQNGRNSTGGLPTPRVTGLQMHEAADNSVVLLWNTVCQGISQGLTNVLYELQFKEFGAKHWVVSSDTIRTTTVSKKGLNPGTRYEFRVRARACGKEGAFSKSIAVRTKVACHLHLISKTYWKLRKILFVLYGTVRSVMALQ